ncbi:membrane protein insertase YidC [Jannaschia seohaensis]|uniref:Membrane protein insertase YidC n=1 Tax=Jannaschia seohaensis TaxID=475081 RepID=A0A2Y9C0S1_9RHOB|nr:membrane protein insertase YidC [Jannaschia seohaensis]PWJ18237.1 YidC/Oxa1 family membrane protein insertase [Jannaschia seohaensis]SSA46762.1 YidC/Oxa1 family membrane protein insertase [Jannaschia seohaensis]
MDEQNKNLILATVLSAVVLLIWFVLFPPEPPAPTEADLAAGEGLVLDAEGGAITPPMAPGATAAPGSVAVTPAESRAAALASAPRIPVETPRLTGSISLNGGRIDDISLLDYRETIDDDSPIVTLLNPAGGPDAYYALHGWIPGGSLGFEDVPTANTEWTAPEGAVLTHETPVTLTWDNGSGLTFTKTIAVDADYMFTVSQGVRNDTGAPVRLAPYGLVARHGEPDTVNFFILHEGVVARSDGELMEINYDDMTDLDRIAAEGGMVQMTEASEDGWIGFTDKYWMTTLIPSAGMRFTEVVKYVDTADIYQTETRLPIREVAAGESHVSESRLFAGAKEWATIREYQNDETQPVAGFIDSIDWGWFYFLTKPIFAGLHWLNAMIGNMGIAIIVLTLCIKAILLPLAYKSYVSMARMKELQPEMEKLKEKAGDDRQKLQQGMMELYKVNKVNPAAGCLPILLQIPIFFSLYKVIFVTLELRHAPFFGPFQDLSAPDPTSIMNLFGLLPFAAPDPNSILALIFIGILPILLGISMWLQQKLNPAPTDPTQAMIFAWLPWVFMFMLGGFASGLIVYWIANNTITFVQQYAIMRSHGSKPDLFGNIKSSFTKKPAAEAGTGKDKKPAKPTEAKADAPANEAAEAPANSPDAPDDASEPSTVGGDTTKPRSGSKSRKSRKKRR